MKILLVRHAEAKDVNGLSILKDFDRPLTTKGKKQGKRLKNSLEKLNLEIDMVVSSPLLRAKETASLVVPAIDEKKGNYIQMDCLSPGGNYEDAIKFLAISKFSIAALFGHMPEMGYLVSYLIGLPRGSITMDKAGAALVDFYGPPAANSGQLEWLITSKWKAKN